MRRPQPTRIYHFTHLSNLASIVSDGLFCDNECGDALTTEVGHRGIKAQRRDRSVKVGAGGAVADYVPFYFAPRSPMLYAIKCGNVRTYSDGQDPIVFLVSNVEQLVDLELAPVFTDRNASLALATHSTDLADLDELVDWALMRARLWHNTDADPERRERRMAECLVHRHVPWTAFLGVATRTEQRGAEVEALLATVGVEATVRTRPEWYFDD